MDPLMSMLLGLLCLISSCICQKMALTIAGFADINVTENGWSSAGVIPAIELALEDINARSDILTDYQLRWEVLDSQCNPGLAIKRLFEHLSRNPPKVMILGGGCSEATEPVAEAATFFNLFQIGYSPGSSSLSNRKRFRTFYRTSPSAAGLHYPIVAVLRHFGWRKVATISEYVPHLVASVSLLHELLKENNITLLAAETVGVNRTPSIQLDNIEEKDAKIIIFSGYEGAARKMFCEAYKKKMYGPHYVWLMPGFYEPVWLNNVDDPPLNCTPHQLKLAANTTFNFKHIKYDTTGQKTISGMTYTEYEQRYINKSKEYSYGHNDYHPMGYDAVWAIALTLNQSIAKLQQIYTVYNYSGVLIKKSLVLEEFDYSMGYAIAFYDVIKDLSFHGVSGQVKFTRYGDRTGPSHIYQFQGSKEEVVGIFYQGKLYLFDDKDIIWHGSGTPSDSLMRTVSKVNINYILFLCVSGLSGAGIVLALSFLIFNIIHVNYRHIKMSSPRLNNLIVFGCILGYVSVCSYGVDTGLVDYHVLPIVCSARSWALSSAFTCAFGAMFAKTWRVHAIFTARTRSSMALHDVHLFAFVGVLLFIDVILLMTWQFLDPPIVTAIARRTEETDTSILVTEIEHCWSHYQLYWVGAIYVEKGLLLVFGCFLAYETRHVHVPGLNDSKYIGMCVYNVVVMCIVGVTISLALSDKKDVSFAFLSFCILFCSTFTLCLLFIPKIRRVRLDIADGVALKNNQDCGKGRRNRAFSSTFLHTMEQLAKMNQSFNEEKAVQIQDEIADILDEKNIKLEQLGKRIEELELLLTVINQARRRQSRDSLFHTIASSTPIRNQLQTASTEQLGPPFCTDRRQTDIQIYY